MRRRRVVPGTESEVSRSPGGEIACTVDDRRIAAREAAHEGGMNLCGRNGHADPIRYPSIFIRPMRVLMNASRNA